MQENQQETLDPISCYHDCLEYHAAALMLDCWGKRCTDPAAPQERKQQLHKKLSEVRTGIGGLLGRGKNSTKFPDEVVLHEYQLVYPVVEHLFDSVGTKVWSSDQLLGARCDYGAVAMDGKTTCLFRPLFLNRQLVDHLAGRNSETCKKTASEFAELLTADLFGISPKTMPKKLANAREDDRFWQAPTNTQKFLVAAFLIGARTQCDGDGSAGNRLLRILDALFKSGYDAKGVYHLAAEANKMTPSNLMFADPRYQETLATADEVVAGILGKQPQNLLAELLPT